MPLNSESFKPVIRTGPGDAIVRPHATYGQDAWRRLKQHKLAMSGLYTIVLIVIIAVIGPWLSPISYSDQNLLEANLPPDRKSVV
jgi:oligopeptide transport system permease protein